MILLDEDDMASEIFSDGEMLEDPVEFPPPVVFSLRHCRLSVVTMDIRPPGVGTIASWVPY